MSAVYAVFFLLLLSTSNAATWNKVNLNFSFLINSRFFGIAVSDDVVFFAPDDGKLRSFDVTTQTVTLLAQIVATQTDAVPFGAFCADRNGTLYFQNNNVFSTYNISTNTWKSGPTGFESASSQQCVLNPFTNQIHFLGGQYTTHQVFDIATKTWNTTWPPLPAATGYNQQVYFDEVDQRIYVAGGANAATYYLVQVYHFSNHSWTTITAPDIIRYASVVRIGDELHILGGQTNTGDLLRVQYYNILDGTWTMDSPLQAPNSNTGNGFLIGTTMYLLSDANLQWSHCYAAVDVCGASTDCVAVGCNATTGECTSDLTTNSCDDGDICTMNDTCQLGVCSGNDTNPSCLPVSQPLTSEPSSNQPAINQPSSNQPSTNQPMSSEPKPTKSPCKQSKISAATSFFFAPTALISWFLGFVL